MAHMWKLEVNGETEEALLYQCLSEAKLSSDTNLQRKAGEAQTELDRREQEKQKEQFVLENKERVKAQKFQKALADEQLVIADKQLEIAGKQLSLSEKLGEKQITVAWLAAIAAGASAVAAIVLAVLAYMAWSSTSP